MRTFKLVLVASLALTGLVGVSGAAGAHDSSEGRAELVRMQDDCDPQTFNLVLGEGACVGDGDTTFDEFVEEVQDEGEAGKWRNKPEDFTIRRGERLRVLNQGGEFHSWTEVPRFGPGCVPELNELAGFEGAPVMDCEDPALFATLVAPGDRLSVRGLARGRHLFECLIHPWMQSTLEVREAHHH